MAQSKIILFFLLFSSHLLAQTNNAKAVFSMPLEQTYFRRYAHPLEDSLVLSATIKDERITANDKLETSLASKYPNATATHIRLFHKLTLNNLGEEYAVVKFQEMKDTLNLSIKTMVFKISQGQFEELKITSFEHLVLAMSYCKTETFRAMLNTEKTDYPAIDAIKAQFKDAEGVLDIDKLGTYLKTKPKALEKYCDW